MPIEIHTVEVIDGSDIRNFDRVVLAVLNAVPNAASSGGGPVSTAVAFPFYQFPAGYSVKVTPSQACMTSVTAKTSNGFNVVLTPAFGNVAAGMFDVVVIG